MKINSLRKFLLEELAVELDHDRSEPLVTPRFLLGEPAVWVNDEDFWIIAPEYLVAEIWEKLRDYYSPAIVSVLEKYGGSVINLQEGRLMFVSVDQYEPNVYRITVNVWD
ncbi:MAG: hypothetical protein ACOX0C_02215 [Patescibacteria group bacterium]|jgi:hypothetical protein